ncbi:MAG: MFS transporter [Gemmataceae bacterium]|nr:MFS transporter [Gemmataceae bacterium]
MNEASSKRPTRTRFILVAWLCGLAGVLYLDRVCMQQAIAPIKAELNLTNTQISYALMAFTLAYGIFEMPTGRLGDRIGSRFVLTRIVIWWSLFTALTGAAWGFSALIVVRFLFGAGEAGAFPNAARVISRWFPAHERGRVQGIMLTAAQLGGVAAPTVAAELIQFIGWRWAFVVFGMLGVIWAFGFWCWFRDDPAKDPRVNAEELAIIQGGGPPPSAHVEPIPWKAVLSNSGLWLLAVVIVCSSFNSYLYYSWFSNYLEVAHKLTNRQAGRLSSLVLAGSAIGVLSGGMVADRILKGRLPVVWGRRLLGCGTYLLAAGCLMLAVRAEEPRTLAMLAGLSCLCVQLTLPTWWSATIEQSGKHVGALFGLLNMIGLIGALCSQWYVGALSDARKAAGFKGREQWDPMFDLFVVVLLVGSLAWLLYRKRPLP